MNFYNTLDPFVLYLDLSVRHASESEEVVLSHHSTYLCPILLPIKRRDVIG